MPANVETMLSSNDEIPWHKEGKVIEGYPKTTKEAIELAGLDWDVALEPMKLMDGKDVEGFFGVVRQDTKKTLGVVGKRYQPIQNSRAFEFLDDSLGSDLKIETAGSLDGGKRIWAMAKMVDKKILIAGEDIVDQYLLITNGHDGGNSCKGRFTPIRVVCQNTLNAALGTRAEWAISVRHTASADTKLEVAADVIAKAMAAAEATAELYEGLAEIKLSVQQFDDYLGQLIKDEEGKKNTRRQNERDAITDLFDTGRGMDIKTIRHTAWAAYNAVTEHVDHHRTVKGDNGRLSSIAFGNGNRLKQKALKTATEMFLVGAGT